MQDFIDIDYWVINLLAGLNMRYLPVRQYTQKNKLFHLTHIQVVHSTQPPPYLSEGIQIYDFIEYIFLIFGYSFHPDVLSTKSMLSDKYHNARPLSIFLYRPREIHPPKIYPPIRPILMALSNHMNLFITIILRNLYSYISINHGY